MEERHLRLVKQRLGSPQDPQDPTREVQTSQSHSDSYRSVEQDRSEDESEGASQKTAVWLKAESLEPDFACACWMLVVIHHAMRPESRDLPYAS